MASKQSNTVPTSWQMCSDILVAINKARLTALKEYDDIKAANGNAPFTPGSSLPAHTAEFLLEVERTLEAEMSKTAHSSRLPMPDLRKTE